MCNLKNVWECMLLVHERDSPLAVCPQHCTVAHTLSPDVHIWDLPSPFEKSAERSGAVQELHQLRSAWAETWSRDWVNTGLWTGSTGSGTTRRQQKTPSLHTCLPRSFSRGTSRDLRRNVGILEEVQPGQRRNHQLRKRPRTSHPQRQCTDRRPAQSLKVQRQPVQLWGWCPPVLGSVARQFWGWSHGGGCPRLCSSFWEFTLRAGDCAQSPHSRAFLPRQQASCFTRDTSSPRGSWRLTPLMPQQRRTLR